MTCKEFQAIVPRLYELLPSEVLAGIQHMKECATCYTVMVVARAVTGAKPNREKQRQLFAKLDEAIATDEELP